MGHSDDQEQIGFDGIQQTVGKMKEYLTADRSTHFLGSAGMGNDNGYHPVYFRNECQADSGCFVFVVAGSLTKLFIRLRQEFVVYDNSAIALLKTSLPGIPLTLPAR
jgi:hypothetical protein